jgi:membrane-associated protein
VDKPQALSQIMAVNVLKAESLIDAFGLVGVYAVVFLETGLFFGFFLPGDSLLFVAGIASSPMAETLVGTKLSLPALLVGVPLAAIAGSQLGHFLGARFGRALFDRPESRVFKSQYVTRSERYFNRFGPARAVVLARFIPVVRAFLSPVAGILGMPARTFLLWNVVGGVLWTDSILLLGHYTAGAIPQSLIDRYMFPVVGLIVVVSILPMLIEVVRGLRRRREAPEPEKVDSADR